VVAVRVVSKGMGVGSLDDEKTTASKGKKVQRLRGRTQLSNRPEQSFLGSITVRGGGMLRAKIPPAGKGFGNQLAYRSFF